ncbi:MAG: HD domain-containing phosphohydrolase, partial [Planctomycetota bacterium]
LRGTLRPIEILREGTRAIAHQRFDEPVSLSSGDEFQELGDSLNQMAANLGRQFRILDAIDSINRTVIVSMDAAAIVGQVVRRLPEVSGCDACAVALLDEPAGTTSVTFHGQDGWECSRVEPTDAREVAIVKALHADRLQESDELPGFLSQLRDRELARVLLLPLYHDSKLAGVLVCAFQDRVTLDDQAKEDVRSIANQMLIGVANARLVEGLERLSWGTLTALARAIDAKSQWTSGHSERVMRLTIALSDALDLPSDRREVLRRAALLHDVGKIGTPIAILDKQDKLTDTEKGVMNQHVQLGCEILEPIEAFRESVPIVRQHHERLDGSGYPAGLEGSEICQEARVLAVADCYDAMRSPRPYRGSIPRKAVLSYMQGYGADGLDQSIVTILIRVLEQQPQLDPHEDKEALAETRGGQ